jgi:molybdate transport system permease protein
MNMTTDSLHKELLERDQVEPVIPSMNRRLYSLWKLGAIPLLAFFLIPIVVMVTRTSPLTLVTNLVDNQVEQALIISIKTTLISLAIILLFGTPLAYLMGRYRFPLKNVVDTLIDLPTVLPPSVAGVALLLTFGRMGPLGGWLTKMGINLAFTQAAVVMAQVFIASPYFIRAASLGFANIDEEYIQAAQLDGAGRLQILRYLTLPLASNALVSGGVMSWSRALGEFGATILFAGNFIGRTQTMPLAIYLGFETNLDVALTLSVILVGISFISLLAIKSLAVRPEVN